MVRKLFWAALPLIILSLIFLTEVPETVTEQALVLELSSLADITGQPTDEHLIYVYSPA
jgi:hypothetical protein